MKTKKIFAILILAILITPLFASAANPCSLKGIGGTATKDALPRCVNQVYVWSLGLGAILAMLIIVLGGYYVMTARGNAEQAEKGKGYISQALVGVVLLFLAYLLLNQINPDLVKLKLDSFDDLNRASQEQQQTTIPAPAAGAPRN